MLIGLLKLSLKNPDQILLLLLSLPPLLIMIIKIKSGRAQAACPFWLLAVKQGRGPIRELSNKLAGSGI